MDLYEHVHHRAARGVVARPEQGAVLREPSLSFFLRDVHAGEVVGHEGLTISQAELQAELSRLLLDYNESERASVAQTLQTQMLNNVASSALDRKLRERLVAIAVGEAPALEGSVAPAAVEPEGAEVEIAEVEMAEAAAVEPEAAEAEAAEPAVKAVE